MICCDKIFLTLRLSFCNFLKIINKCDLFRVLKMIINVKHIVTNSATNLTLVVAACMYR